MTAPGHSAVPDSGPPIRVLHVDADEAFLARAAPALEQALPDGEVVTATDPAVALETAARVDCVVSGGDFPGADGLAFFRAVRDRHPALPFVLFTEAASAARVREALAAGVTDCLSNGGPAPYERLAVRLADAVAHRRTERALDRSRSRSAAAGRVSKPALAGSRASSRPTTVRSDGGVEAPRLDELKQRALDEAEMGIVISEATDDTPTLFANEGYARLTGYDSEEMVGRNCRILQGPGTDDDTVASIRAALDDREPVSVVIRNYRKDGTPFWNELAIDPIRTDGAVTHFIGFQRDVTERTQLQLELEAAQQSLRRLYTVTTDTSLSLRERIERTLEIGCERLGVELGFLTHISEGEQTIVQSTDNHPLLETGAACPLDEAYCRRTLDSDGLLSVVHAAADERWVDDPGYEKFGLECYIGGKVSVDGDLFGTLCFADITPREEPFSDSQSTFVELLTRWVAYELERQRHERELRATDRRFRALFENPMTFAGLLDPEGVLQEANDTALSTLASRDDVIGRPFWEAPWWAPNEESVRTVREATEAAASGEIARFECEYVTTDGRGTVGATLYPVYGDGRARTIVDEIFEDEGDSDAAADQVVSIMAVGADTTTRTEQAAQLEEQRDRLEEFASVVSHDLRSPLEVARGRLELYDRTGDERHLQTAVKSVDRMSTLIDDLLELARQGDSVAETEPVRLSTVAERAWTAVETTGMTLALDVDSEMTVEADPSRLQQLFENLLRNTADHAVPSQTSTAAGATDGDSPTDTVTVRVTGLTDTDTDTDTDADGFAVEDDGPGIDPDVRETLFEHGVTTEAEGTGFGLAIVSQIVDAHGWDIVATASERGGARFEITVSG